MNVTLIGQTAVDPSAIGYAAGGDYLVHAESTSGEDLIEFAGRSCYQSFSRPNPDTATIDGYMDNIIDSGHFSVLEHATATVYVTGVSRSLTHELVRHRHFSYSQMSQRFVNGETSEMVTPPAIRDSAHAKFLLGEMERAAEVAREAYRNIVHVLDREGLGRKQSREAARAVLPNATETRIVVTGNMRAWRDFLAKRYSIHADAEIREFAVEMLAILRDVAPTVFADFPDYPFGA